MKKLIFLSLVFLVTSCCRQEDYDLPDSYEPHFLFPAGSEWVMQNSVSGANDTIRCYFSLLGRVDMCGGGAIECDGGGCDDEITSENLNMSFSSQEILADSFGIWTTMGLNGEESGVIAFGERMFIDPLEGNEIEDLRFLTTHSSLTINNLILGNVSVFRDGDSQIFGGGVANYYFAENVGWVKFEDMTTGEAWEIVSWSH